MTWLLTAVVLTACGGGGGAGSGGFLGTSDTPPYRMTISATDGQGNAVNTFSSTRDLYVTAQLKNLDGKAVPGVAVSLSAEVGAVDPANGSSLTNDNGVASFVVSYNGTIGAGAIEATYAASEGDVTATMDVEAFEIIPFALSLKLFDQNGNPSNELTGDAPLTAIATLTSRDGSIGPISNEAVSLTSTVGTVSPDNGSSLTDNDGLATFTITYDETTGAGVVTAIANPVQGNLTFSVSAQATIEAVNQTSYLLELATYDSDGNESNRFLSNSTLNIVASLFRATGNELTPVSDALLTAGFTLGEITPASGTKLTDENGKAIFVLGAGSDAGAGVLSVSFELPNGGVIERSQTFEIIEVVDGTAYTIDLKLFDSQGNESRTVSSEEPLTAVVTLSSLDGIAPIENQIITLSSDLAAVLPESGTQLTDQAGQAEFRLEVNGIVGAGTVTASFGSGEGQIASSINIETVIPGLNQTLRIVTRSSSGFVSNTFSEGSSLFVDVTLVDEDGSVANLDDLVIALDSEIGQVFPGTGTSLTSNGVARFELAFDGTVGAGIITATYQTSAGTLTATQAVEALGTETYTVTLTTPSSAVTPSSPQNVSVTVRRGSSYAGSVVYNELVTLTSEATDIEPTNGGALTTGGSANFTLKFNGTEGAGRVTATYVAPNGDTFTNSAAVYAENEQTPYQLDIQQASGSTFSNVNPLPLTVLLTSNGNPVTDAVINLESDVGVITPNNSAALTNSSGIATFSLLGDGSTGAGSVTATFAPQDGDEITDVITVQMLSSDEEVNFDRVSMTFVGADPLSIALRGTGGGTGLEERSEVRFRLTDPAGNPVTDQVVSFRLSTTLGGIELLEPQVVSDSNGEVVATVWAGAIPTPVRVIAETESTPLDNTDDPLRVFSDVLTIAAGVATQQRFTVVADVLNPPDAAAVDGIEVNITAFLFDRFGNPVPDGTAVSFSSECGGVGSSGGPTGACLTTTGSCSVTWFSQNVGDPEPGTPSTQIPGFCSDGRATILGYALGEEDYDDNDSDGFYTVGGTVNGSLSSDAWTPSRQDNSEAFLDADEAGTQSGREFFVDWADNNLWDEFTGDPLNAPLVEADSKYNGAACVKDENNTTDDYNAALDCYNNLVYVFDSVVLVPGPSESGSLTLTTPVGFTGATVGSSYIFTLGFEADGEENIPPLGTTISVSAEGECEIVGTDSWEIPNSNARSPYVFGFTVGPATGTPPSLLTIEWQTPSGVPQQAVYNCSP